MTKILITGSNGLLGNQLINDLTNNKKYVVIALSKNKPNMSVKNVIYETCNINDSLSLAIIFDKYNPDTVIHTAAISSPDLCEDNRNEAWAVNVNATKYIAELCFKHKSHLVHLSSDFVFDGFNAPYVETDEPNPLSFYGLSKLESEKVVADISDSFTIIRTILVYGIHKSLSRSNILTRTIENLNNNKAIRIVSDQYRAPTFLNDLSKACIKAAEIKAKGIYHISGNQMFSVYDFCLKIADSFNLNKNLITKISTIELNEKAHRPYKTSFVLNKAITDLNYSASSIEEGLKFYYNQPLI